MIPAQNASADEGAPPRFRLLSALSYCAPLIVNGVACVPPQNKPTTEEIKTCRQFVSRRLAEQRPRAYLALGRIAHDQLLSALGEKRSRYSFGHGAEHDLTSGARLFDSYHCSRYNTNTGVLTTEMFEDVVGRAAAYIAA